MFHLYRYVPPCARCGSYKTGYYVHGLITSDWIIRRALRRGEYIMFTSRPSTLENNNCFCGNCGVEWHEDDLELKLLNEKQFQEQIKLRGIEEAKENSNIYFENEKEKFEQEQKKNEKPKWYKRLARTVKKSWFGETSNK